MLITLALKATIFTKADDANFYPPRLYCEEVKNPDGSIAPRDAGCTDPNYEQKQLEEEKIRRVAHKQREAANALAMIIVAAPVFYYHWKLARRET